MTDILPTEQDVLLHAAEVLQRDGWTQGQYRDAATGRRCLIGAIRQAEDELCTDSNVDPVGVLQDWFAKEGVAPPWDRSLALWNDRPERTAEDVILACKRAAIET